MQLARWLEPYLAIIAAAGCVVITVAVWWDFSAVQPMWPLPALYLIEVTAVSIAAATAFLSGRRRGWPIPWAAVGILMAFCILGMFSVGPLYLPTTLLLAIACVTSGIRNRVNLGIAFGIVLVAGLVQAAVMLTVIRVV